MNTADSYSDRRSFSTDNNEYATGINDENEWEENILDNDVPLDDEIDDWFDDPDDWFDDPDQDDYVYNESGFDRERIY